MKRKSTTKSIFFLAALTLAGFARAEEPIVLEFWDFPHMPGTTEWIQKAIGEFESERPGVKVRYTRLPWLDGQQKVTLAVLGGQPPDLCCQVSNNISQFIAQDALEPLNDVLAPELHDFHETYIDAVSFQDNIYAVPWYQACYVMALNVDIFERFNVPLPENGRWTWDEFLEKMNALTREAPIPDQRLNPATPAYTTPAKYYGLVTNLGVAEYEAYSIIYNFGGRVLRKNADGTVRASAADADFINGLEHLQALDFEHGVAAPGIGAFTQKQSWELWKDTGTVAATFQGGWIISALNKSNQEQERANARLIAAGRPQDTIKPFRWSLAAPPTLDKETTPVLASSGLGTFVVFKNENKRRVQLAKELAMHLVTGEGQQVLKEECVYPSRKSAGNPYADDPMIGPVFDLFPSAVLTPLVPGGERIDRVFQQEIQKSLLRVPGQDKPQSTAAEAARAANAKVEAVLERARRRFGSLKD